MKLKTKCLGLLVIAMLVMVAPSIHATQSTTYFIYEESSHVIGEYDANGSPIQKGVYM